MIDNRSLIAKILGQIDELKAQSECLICMIRVIEAREDTFGLELFL